MSVFDSKAATWDADPAKVERATIIANRLKTHLNFNEINSAIEYGSGTGLLAFEMRDDISKIYLYDESEQMTKVAQEKADKQQIKSLVPIQSNILKDPLPKDKVDFIFILLTLHHIVELDDLYNKFHQMLNPNGKLAIIDLVEDDGSFHDYDFGGYNGFNRQELEARLLDNNFQATQYEICYEITKKDTGKQYPLFLSISERR